MFIFLQYHFFLFNPIWLKSACLLHTAVAVYTLFLFAPLFDRQGRLPKISLAQHQVNGHSLALRNLMACIMQKNGLEYWQMTPHIERKKPKIIQNENEEDIAVEDKKKYNWKVKPFQVGQTIIAVYDDYCL